MNFFQRPVKFVKQSFDCIYIVVNLSFEVHFNETIRKGAGRKLIRFAIISEVFTVSIFAQMSSFIGVFAEYKGSLVCKCNKGCNTTKGCNRDFGGIPFAIYRRLQGYLESAKY